MSDEAQAAKAELGRAVQAYIETIEPGTYVDGWVLITNKLSIDMEQRGESAVGLTYPEQSWVLVRGLLDIAMQSERDDQRELNDD